MTRFLKLTLLCLACFFIISASCAYSQENSKFWLFKTRIQQGVEYDNNIFEAKDEAENDGLYKIIFDSQAKFSRRHWLGQFQYHGGYQHYFNTPSENKLTNHLQASILYATWKNKISFGCRSRMRFKYFFSRDWEYSLTDIEPFIAVNIFQTRFSFFYNNEKLNYFQYDQFNYIAHTINFAVTKRLIGNFQVQLKGGQQTRNYKRFALEYKPFLDSPLYSDYLHKDASDFGGIQFSYQKHLLCSLEYIYQENSSNSYGFSFQQHRLTLSTALPLKTGMLLRIFSGLQQKNYTESLNRIILTELDTERENSNFLIVDFSKNITPSLGLIIRSSWYNNESPIPERYYQKSLTSISFEYQF